MSADKDDRDLLDVPVLGHLGVIIVDGVEGGLVLETEDEDHSVHPGRELKEKKIKTMYFPFASTPHLEFRRPSLVPDEQEVALTVHHDLLLEPPALGALLLHVAAGEVAVHQGGLAGAEAAHDAEPDLRDISGQSPLLGVDKRV